VLDWENQAPIGAVIDVDRLPRCHGATRTLDPDFKVTGWQHELIRSPLVSRNLDAPASADRDDLEWFEQCLERGLTIGAQNPSEHVAVHNALPAALLLPFEIHEILGCFRE
jgi:hypothetical protein